MKRMAVKIVAFLNAVCGSAFLNISMDKTPKREETKPQDATVTGKRAKVKDLSARAKDAARETAIVATILPT